MGKRNTLSAIIIIGLVAAAGQAMAVSPMTATIRVSGGSTYDYVTIGMSSYATDGFDNAYDTFAPAGNMNDTYIITSILHPEWNQVKSQFRGDFRALAERQEWQVTVASNLPAGADLTVTLDKTLSTIPVDGTLTAEHPATSQQIDLRNGSLQFTLPAPNVTQAIKIVATMPATVPPPPIETDSPSIPATDHDGDTAADLLQIGRAHV